MPVKTITIKTNYNHKLACDCFPHIDVAPSGIITESKLADTIIEIRTADGSHPPVKTRLEDLARIPLRFITSVITWPSHGMSSEDFRKWITEQNPNINLDSSLAVYFYKKIA